MTDRQSQIKKSVKITILGKGMVGKSSLTYKFINYDAPEEHDPTIEDKFLIVMDIDGNPVTINILDTAGQDDYQSLLETWIDNGDGFLLIFALNDKESFIELDRKKAKIDSIKRKTKVPLILVGNKCDLESERQVTRREGEEKARQWGGQYFETSAIKGINCNEPFIECSRQLLNKDKKEKENEVGKKKEGCCNVY